MFKGSYLRYSPDLRGYIKFLEDNHPEELIYIKKEVDPEFGVSGILHRLEMDNHFEAVIFENLKDSNVPLVANMHAGLERLRYALGMETGDIDAFLAECATRQMNPIPPEPIGIGPVQEMVLTGDQIDIERFPICKYHALDAGIFYNGGFIRYV